MMEQSLNEWRNMLNHEWNRQTFDALALPYDELQLSGYKAKKFRLKAFNLCSRINWNGYDNIRTTFQQLADRMVDPYVSGWSAERIADMKRRMYVRFMEGRIRFFQILEKEEHCPLAPIPVGMADYHNVEMATVFAHLPVNEEVKAWLKEIEVSWDYDRLHMVTWFAGQLSLGSGKYSRSRPNHSASTTYQRLLNPYSLLWIAAALGVDEATVREAAAAAKPKETYREKCVAIRNLIPFSRIYELALPLVEKERKENETPCEEGCR